MLITGAFGVFPWVLTGVAISSVAAGFMSLFSPLAVTFALIRLVDLDFDGSGANFSNFTTGDFPLIGSMFM